MGSRKSRYAHLLGSVDKSPEDGKIFSSPRLSIGLAATDLPSSNVTAVRGSVWLAGFNGPQGTHEELVEAAA